MKRRFQKGSGCFTCIACKKQTRDTGDNGALRLCPLCQAKSENGNSLSDAGYGEDAWAVFDNCQSVAECEELCIQELAKLAAQERK